MGLAGFVKESTEDQQVKGKKHQKTTWTAMAMLKNKRGHSEQKKGERVDKTSTTTERWWEIIKGARRYENQREWQKERLSQARCELRTEKNGRKESRDSKLNVK